MNAERLWPVFKEVALPELQKLMCFDPKIMTLRQCRKCNTRNPKQRCQACLIPYCDQKCQLRDWPEHKKECKAIASVRGLQLSDQTGPCNIFMEALYCSTQRYSDK